MVTVNTVMACLDLSDYSRETIAYAVMLARGYRSRLIIFNVINRRDVEAVSTVSHFYPEVVTVDDFLEQAENDRRQRINALIAEVFPGEQLDATIVVEVGVPFEAILQAISTHHIDVVVLANKGKNNIGRTLLGNNAEKVIRHSPVPVFSVRNRETFGRKQGREKP